MEEISADEFDELLEQEEQEEAKPVGRMPNLLIKDLIVRPDVARALVSGVPPQVIAQELGVAPATVRKWMNSFEMSDLLDIESRRLIKHLSRRDLSKEKYLGLATALAVIIDKARILRDGVPEPSATINQTIIQNIKIGLFGRSIDTGSKGDSGAVTELSPDSVRSVDVESESKQKA